MKAISDPGSYFLPGSLIFGYWLWKYRRQAVIQAALLSLLVVGVDLIGAQIKQRIARPRPCRALEKVETIMGCGEAFSFPSNHAANSAAGAVFLRSYYPRITWMAAPLVIVIGVSRIYVGAHYSSDVGGGWLLGAGMAWAFVALLRWLRKRNE
jgi:undecaprenyl-diphosphatase